MKITSYSIGKMIQEYKVLKAKEKWNTCAKNLTQDQILKFGDDKITYDQAYDYVLDMERNKDDLETTNTNRSTKDIWK